MRFKRLIEPRLDAPLPLWMIFPVIFAALYASHFTLLALPYYWDEAGYYIPAAWDFYRTGSLIPITTLTNAHPPLPSIYLALWWKASGFLPEVTREAVLLVASLGLLAVWRLAMRLVGVVSVAFWTVLLTGLYPIWFAQSSLAHADIFAAACTLWGLVFALPARDRKPWAAALWFSAAALCKETAIAIPLTLAAVSLAEAFRKQEADPNPADRRRLLGETARLSSCILPLVAGTHGTTQRRDFCLAIPNSCATTRSPRFDPLRFLAAFGHRLLHLTMHMNMFVPVLMTIAALLLAVRPGADGKDRAASRRCAADDSDSASGECCLVQRAGRRAADALSAAHVSTGAAGRGHDVLPPHSLLAWGCGVFGGGVSGGVVRQSAVWICAGRQSGLRACGAASPVRHCTA